jgi:hypothetical protein
VARTARARHVIPFQWVNLMKQLFSVMFMAAVVVGLAGPVRGDDAKAADVLDKAIKAIGGQEKLDKIKGISWKAKGTITINGSDNPFSVAATAQGVDHLRSEFSAKFGENEIKAITVINGDKGWRKAGGMGGPLDKEQLANEKRNLYVVLAPVTLVPLKGKDFKLALTGEEKVGGKPAVGLKNTGPDGKDFKVFFDKESGLPVKVVAQLKGFMGEDVTQETTFSGWKEFGGIKKATKMESKRDGEKFSTQEITEFKTLSKVDEKTFAEPE